MHECWNLFFSGQVQGVGFRYNAWRVAKQFEVSGWVRNLADGRVEMIAQGERTTLRQFVDRVSESTHGNVLNVDIQRTELVTEFTSFEIRP